jgi:hypothetical protein
MKKSNHSKDKSGKAFTKNAGLSRALEYLQQWADSQEPVEFTSRRQPEYAVVHTGIIIAKSEADGIKTFELAAAGGTRILLSPCKWEHVRTRKLPMETVVITSGTDPGEEFLLHPPYRLLLEHKKIQMVEEQLHKWAGNNTTVVINMGFGFFSYFFCGKVVEPGPHQFGFKDPERGGIFMAIPRMSDQVAIDESDGYTTLKMTYDKSGAWFEVSDCVPQTEDALPASATFSNN